MASSVYFVLVTTVTDDVSRVSGSDNPWGPLAAGGGASHGRWLVQAPARPQFRGKARPGEARRTEPLPLPAACAARVRGWVPAQRARGPCPASCQPVARPAGPARGPGMPPACGLARAAPFPRSATAAATPAACCCRGPLGEPGASRLSLCSVGSCCRALPATPAAPLPCTLHRSSVADGKKILLHRLHCPYYLSAR
ncbi:uncharacterized protein LOC124775889 [Schistocerca piceifrons]|uniref:uncharacterized protein LOC124775889 n=1 Tax=Schistocerca piceifrons TaxID=274613 RepID=UPI001F5FA863|nr:uncharacterized protein LOC124775889 [Schistocerca piceifrons]